MRSHTYALSALLFITVVFSACRKDKDRIAPQPAPVPIDSVAETQPGLQSALSVKINANIGGLYAAVPFNYTKTTKKYPLIIFIPGGGQYGNGTTDLPLLLNDGMAQLLDEKTFPPNFRVNGQDYSFIVITPQMLHFPSTAEVKDVIDYAIKNYRVDEKRIYMSGLSIGGIVAGDAAATFPKLIAAIVPLAGETQSEANCKLIAENNIPVWDFHSNDDPQLSILEALNFINMLKKYSPPIAPKLTIVTSRSHDAWNVAIHPDYKEDNKNIYEWMLQYSRP
jgi:predicted peptidase